jgi:hypothetical protein
MTPIWKDIYVDLQSISQQVGYTIAIGGTVVYNGICYSEGDSIVRINDVVADYFTRKAPILATSADSNNESAAISVIVRNSAGVAVFNDTVIADYSYEDVDLATHIPYAPIERIIDPRMPIVGTVFNSAHRTITIDGRDTSFSTPIGETFTKTLSSTAKRVEIGDYAWDVVQGCARYGLYYINACGSWEWLVLNGRPTASSNYTRHAVKQKYNNGNPSARSENNWVNEEQKTIALRTGFITDEGAKNMHHLIGSANVYLYDLETAELRPVVITDTSCNEQTYLGNGAKPIQYTINVRLAQDYIRR